MVEAPAPGTRNTTTSFHRNDHSLEPEARLQPGNGEQSRLLDAAFAPWQEQLSAEHLIKSFDFIPPSSRTWFCISSGQLYTASAAACPMYGLPHCGICASDKRRKDAVHHIILEYLRRSPRGASLELCAPFNCGDSPKAHTGESLKLADRLTRLKFGLSKRDAAAGNVRRTDPVLMLGYTASPSTHDIPFPDYRVWQAYPHLLREVRRAPPPAWEQKLNRAVLAFGNYTFYCGDAKRMTKKGCFWYTGFFPRTCAPKSCNHKFLQRKHNGTFHESIPRVSGGMMPLRHALIHGKCERHNATIDVVNGGPYTPSLTSMPKSQLCRYRFIVLTAGTSNWLSHMAEAFLCGSVVIFVADTANRDSRLTHRRALAHAVSPFSQLLVPDEHYIQLEVNSTEADFWPANRVATCDRLAAAVGSLMQQDARMRRIAARGTQLVHSQFSLPSIYGYIDAVFQRLAAKQNATVARSFIDTMHGVPVDESNYTAVVVGPTRDPVLSRSDAGLSIQ